MANCYIMRRKHTGSEPPVSIVSWQNGTDEEILAMVEAANAGKINLGDYWNVMDERTVHVNAIAAESNGAFYQAISAQDVTHVLMDNKYIYNSGINFVVGQKECLNKNAYFGKNVGTASWKNGLIRASLNDAYFNALPVVYRQIFKPFNAWFCNSTSSTELDDYTTDKISLFAEKEIIGNYYSGMKQEADGLNTVRYYETTANRKKVTTSGTAASYWLRSIGSNTSNNHVRITTTGTSQSVATNMSSTSYVAPFGCI